MPIKQENEITIRILCLKEELIKHLEEKGRKFRLDDHYLIPKILKLEELTVREILSHMYCNSIFMLILLF